MKKMNNYWLVEIIPNVWSLWFGGINDEGSNVVLKGLSIKKVLGEYPAICSPYGNIQEHIRTFSLSVCISKMRLLDLKRQAYLSAIAVLDVPASKIACCQGWKNIWVPYQKKSINTEGNKLAAE